MLDMTRSGFAEQSPDPLNTTQIPGGLNDTFTQTLSGISTFVGLVGRSQKAGYRQIFPTLDMGRYIEIAEADILEMEELAPAHSPFGALGGTRLSVREDARILTNRAFSTAEVDDEFDLDIRLGASGWSVPAHLDEGAVYAAGGEEGAGPKAIKTNGACPTETCRTCVTCAGENTCQTCHTCKGENTCQTCQTCKGENTCQTCNTQCEQNTCQTCKGEATCQTCQTCNTQCQQQTCQTCKGENTCQTCETQCKQNTCGATCHTCPDHCVPKTQTCCKETCF